MKSILAVLVLALAASACQPAAAPTPDFGDVPEFVAENVVPVLAIPAGAQMFGGGGGGGGNALEMEVIFSADLTQEEVYQHYSEQLTAAGWRFISRQDGISFWELTEANGAVWPAKLEIGFDAPNAPDAYSVKISLLLPQQ